MKPMLIRRRKDLLEPTPREDLQEMLSVVSGELQNLAGDYAGLSASAQQLDLYICRKQVSQSEYG